MDWNEETIARLRQYWQDGHSTAEIGRRMGVTKNAVVGKAHRLALPPRPSPIRRGEGEGHVPRRDAPKRATGPTLHSAAASPVPLPADAVVARSSSALPSGAIAEAPRAPAQLRAVTMPRATNRVTTCCWPIGDPGTASFRFCDSGAMLNKPYCLKHASLAYVKVRDRREDAA